MGPSGDQSSSRPPRVLIYIVVFSCLPCHVNVILMRLEHPLLVSEALLLVRSRFLDLRGLPRPLCRCPRTEELQHAAIDGPAALVDPPAAMDLQCLVESKAKITLLLGGD